MRDLYKVKQLEQALEREELQPEDERYGAHLTHWSGAMMPINIDAGGMRLLIRYYKGEVIDPLEKKIGRWIKDPSGVIICPECGEEHDWETFRASFCDSCGAELDPEEGYDE